MALGCALPGRPDKNWYPRKDIAEGGAWSKVHVSSGEYDNYRTIQKFGTNDAISTVREDIWTFGGNRTWLTAASALQIRAGGDVADTAAGSGAQAIIVQGLDEDFLEIEEEIETAGASASTTTTSTFFRVNRAFVSRVGTYTGNNVGDIVVETTGAVVMADIMAALGQTLQSHFTIPKDRTGFFLRLDVSVEGTKQVAASMFIRPNADDVVAPYSGAMRTQTFWRGIEGLSVVKYETSTPYEGATDIWFTAETIAGNAAVSVHYELILVKIP